MSGAIHPLPQYAFMAWCLVKKHRNDFTFLPTAFILLLTLWSLIRGDIAFYERFNQLFV